MKTSLLALFGAAVIALGIPSATHATYDEANDCHTISKKRFSYCQPHQWELGEINKIKTRKIKKNGSRILQTYNNFPHPDSAVDNGTTIVKVNVWKSEGKNLEQWMTTTLPRGKKRYARMKQHQGTMFFDGKKHLVRNRTVEDKFGSTKRIRVHYVKHKSRIYKFTTQQWGHEYSVNWDKAMKMVSSFTLQ